MEVKTVFVAVDFVHNLGNYSSVKPRFELSADLAHGELPDQAISELNTLLLDHLDKFIMRAEDQHKARLSGAVIKEKPF